MGIKYGSDNKNIPRAGGAGKFKSIFPSLETGTPVFFLFKKKKSNEGGNLQYLFCVNVCQVVTAMGVSRRQGDILSRSWEFLPTETSSLYGCGARSSPWINE